MDSLLARPGTELILVFAEGKMKLKKKILKMIFQLLVPCIKSGHMILDHMVWFGVVLLFWFLSFWFDFVPRPKCKVYNAEMLWCVTKPAL